MLKYPKTRKYKNYICILKLYLVLKYPKTVSYISRMYLYVSENGVLYLAYIYVYPKTEPCI